MRINWTEVKKDIVILPLLVLTGFAAADIRGQMKEEYERERDLEKIVMVSEISEVSEEPGKKKDEKNKQEQKKEKTTEYKTIRQVVIKDFLENYLDKVTPKSSNFKKLKKKHGRVGLLEKYVSAHDLCLDLAYKSKEEITNKQYHQLGLELAKKQDQMSKGVGKVHNLDKKVVSAYVTWGKRKTEHFVKLLEVAKKNKAGKLITKKDKKEYMKELLNKGYSREEYVKYVKTINNASEKLYDSMFNTLSGFEKLFGKGQFDVIEKYTIEVYEDTIDGYFPKLNLQEDNNGRR